jgi:hypothetical protein
MRDHDGPSARQGAAGEGGFDAVRRLAGRFEPGWELEDWLNAEWEVDQRLASHGLEVPVLADTA